MKLVLTLFLLSFGAFAQDASKQIIVQSADIEKCSYDLIPCKDQIYLLDAKHSLSIDYSKLDKASRQRIKLNEDQDIAVIAKGEIVKKRCNTCLGGKGSYFQLQSVEFLPSSISIREKDDSRENLSSNKIHIDLEHLNPFKTRASRAANKQ